MAATQGPPTPLTSLVGRREDVTGTITLLAQHRLVTLTGAGGCGKTRLAVEVLSADRDAVPDSQRFVDLTSATTATEVEAAIALGLSHADRPTDNLRSAIDGITHDADEADPPLLLVVDNCEHVIDPTASVVTAVLTACPSVRILATSREPLGVPGEVTVRVPSLPAGDAAQLFVERAALLAPGVEFDVDDSALRDLCGRLDGIPLAIELAAARTSSLSISEIAAALDDAMGLLTTGPRTALPRHRTLHASIAWSHDLLTDAEAALFRRMAVFAGGGVLEAVREVCVLDDDPVLRADGVVDALHALVAKSLVVGERRTGGGTTRFRMLETVRQYAVEQLVSAADEGHAVALRHRAYIRRLLNDANAAAEGAEQTAWQHRIADELANIRRAMQSSERDGAFDELAELVVAMGTTWALHWLYQEQRTWLEKIVAHPTAGGPWLADALYHLGNAVLGRDLLGARDFLERAIDLYLDEGRDIAAAWARTELSAVYRMLGDEIRAQEQYDVVRELGDREDPTLAFYVRFHASIGAMWVGDIAGAERLAEEVQALDTPVAHHRIWARIAVASVWLRQGLAGAALESLRDAQAQIQPHDGQALTMLRPSLAAALVQAGDAGAALDALREMSPASRDDFHYCFEPDEVAALAQLVAGKAPAQAVELIGEAEALRRRTGVRSTLQLLPSVIDVLLAVDDLEGARRAIGRLSTDADFGAGAPSVFPALGTLRLASIHLAEGDAARAEDLLDRVLPVVAAHGDLRAIIECIELLAAVEVAAAGASGQPAQHAPRLLEAASGLRRGAGLNFVAPFHRNIVERARAGVTVPLPSVATNGWSSLTTAERAVVGLLTEGLTNVQIGARLFISRHTVDSHLRHVFAKLGVSNRAEAAAIAARESRAAEGTMA